MGGDLLHRSQDRLRGADAAHLGEAGRARPGPEARADLFEYIEVFYNRKRRPGYIGNLSPDDFENQSTGSF